MAAAEYYGSIVAHRGVGREVAVCVRDRFRVWYVTIALCDSVWLIRSTEQVVDDDQRT